MKHNSSASIGIDFGTTNSVISFATKSNEVVTRRFRWGDDDVETYRSVLCYWQDDSKAARHALQHASGPAAIDVYQVEGRHSRLLMSLKSYLASRLFTSTRIFSRMFTLEQLIGTFLNDLVADSEISLGQDVTVFAGRPVNFSMKPELNSFAEDRLRMSFAAAGISKVTFVYEPQAAIYSLIRDAGARVVLVADLGGGTSDFSILRISPKSGTPSITPLGSAGIAIAGDTFDYRIIDNVVTPLLGKGSLYKPLDQFLPVPLHYYQDFARWHLLALMNSHSTLRELRQIQRSSDAPQRIANLIHLVESERGLALYRLVSRLKAALSHSTAEVLDLTELGISDKVEVRRDNFDDWIAGDLALIDKCISGALVDSNVSVTDIDEVYLTGGTSLVPAVRRLIAEKFFRAATITGREFQSVSQGLAILGREATASSNR